MNVAISYIVVVVRVVLLGRYFWLARGNVAVALGVSELLALVTTCRVLRVGSVDHSRVGVWVPFLYLTPLLFKPVRVWSWPMVSIWFGCLGLQVSVRLWLRWRLTVGVAVFSSTMCTGPYAFVRHPLAVVEMLGSIAYSTAFMSSWNWAVGLLCVVCSGLAGMVEERFLRSFESYRDYACRVRWRFVPGVF